MKNRFFLFFLLFPFLFASDCGKIRIGRISYTSPKSLLIAHHPLVLHLRKMTGCEDVEMVLFLSYQQIHERLLKKELEMGWLGSSFYASQKEKNYIPLVRPDWYGSQSYQGQFLVRKDSRINSFDDIKGKKVAFVSVDSSSGYVFPLQLMKSRGISLNDLSEYAFLDKHDAVVYAVFARQFDAGACFYGILNQDDLVDMRDHLRILEVTPPISNEPLVIRKEISSEIQVALKDAFLSANQYPEVLKSLKNLQSFSVVSDEDYDPIRKLSGHVQ